MWLPLGIGTFYTLSVGNVAPPIPSGTGGTTVGDQMACVRFVPAYTLEHPTSMAFSYTTTERKLPNGNVGAESVFCSVSLYGPNPSSPLLYTTGPLEADLIQSLQVSVPYTVPIYQGSDYNLCWGCSIASGARNFGTKSCTSGTNQNGFCVVAPTDCPGVCQGGVNFNAPCLASTECPSSTCNTGTCTVQNSPVTVLGANNNPTTSTLANTTGGFIGPPVQIGTAKNLMSGGVPPPTTGNISNNTQLPGVPLVALRQE